MTAVDKYPEQVAKLRAQAEAIVRHNADPTKESIAALSDEETWRLLHELRVHQIELEMQNEELRRTQLALDTARARYFDLYDLAPVGYCSVSESGLILEANLTAATLLGSTRNKLLKQRFTRFISKDDQDHYYLQRKKLIENGEVPAFELHMVSNDGTPFSASLACTLSKEVGEEDIVLRIVLSNISELKAISTKLEVTEKLVMQSEKMAAVGQLAAGVAHEINNPTSYVNANLGTLAEYLMGLLKLVEAYRFATKDYPPEDFALLEANRLANEFQLDYVRDDAAALLLESKDGLDRIRRIVTDLKDFSHVDGVAWETVDLHACLEKTLNIVWNELKYKATLVKDYGDLPAIAGLPNALSQVFMNLLINAAQAIPEHGTITLRTGCEVDSVWVEVEDSGVGIESENLSRLFEPFFTTKPVGIGTGLGMSVSHSIIQKHKGRINVHSTIGQGSTFRVCLPIDPASAIGLAESEVV